jgi:hypothetical protein
VVGELEVLRLKGESNEGHEGTEGRVRVQWPFFSIWNTVLPPTGKKLSGAGTIFQILMNADCIRLSCNTVTGHKFYHPWPHTTDRLALVPTVYHIGASMIIIRPYAQYGGSNYQILGVAFALLEI